MNWQEISGDWVLLPKHPIGIIHFLGGAFVGVTPHITYRYLLECLGRKGYVIIATSFINTFDHRAIARSVLNRFETILERLQAQNAFGQGYFPIYGLGHSMGCKLHLLIGSLFAVERAGNILISYNNYNVNRSIPLAEQFQVSQNLNLEFTPSPEETNALIAQKYQIRRNLLITFINDELDQCLSLNPVLQKRFQDLVTFQRLPGNHLTPLGQEFSWQPGQVFTPFDALGQWFKQEFYRDLHRLQQEILHWLNSV